VLSLGTLWLVFDSVGINSSQILKIPQFTSVGDQLDPDTLLKFRFQIITNIFKNFNETAFYFEYKIMINHSTKNDILFDTMDRSDDKMIKAEVDDTLRKRIEELATLNEIGRAISSATKVNQLIQLIYKQTIRIMEVSAFYIALYDEKNKKMQIIFDVLNGKRQKEEETTREFGNGRTEHIIRTKTPLLIKQNPHETYKKLGIVSSDKKAKACVGVPLLYGNKAIGALVVQSYAHNYAYDDGHVNLLTTIANQAAIAIENARLFENLQTELTERKIIEKRLKERNTDLIRVKKDTDNILNNVKDGLFLINEGLKIGSQYSAALSEIFEEDTLAGKSIINYMRNKVPQKILSTLKDYLTLSFDQSIDGESLLMLNPLSQIRMDFRNGKTKDHSKYLTFDFRRIYNNDNISDIIVSVNDVTEQVTLAKNLEESKEQSKKQMEWLFTILNVDIQMLEEFMKSSDDEITTVKELIDKRMIQESADGIYRSVHLIKGNASMLGINFLAEEAHVVEESLVLLRGSTSGKREIQRKLINQLEEFFGVFDQVKNLIDRIGNFHAQFRPTRKHESDMLFKSISKLIETLCTKYKKEADLDYSKYDSTIVPPHHRLLIRDILVQLTRNAIYHGIETKKERVKKKKAVKGCIHIANSLDDRYFKISFRDDGGGLQMENIKNSAISLGAYKKSEINKWSKKRVIDLIFLPGLTTTENSDITAGRGVGMDIINNKIKKTGGAVVIETEPDNFTQFTIKLPLNK
jgi:signal transduction histidine kinase